VAFELSLEGALTARAEARYGAFKSQPRRGSRPYRIGFASTRPLQGESLRPRLGDLTGKVRRHGARLLVEGAEAMGHLDLDARRAELVPHENLFALDSL